MLFRSSNFDKAKVLVGRQLVGGAKFALATAKTHYPRMDYSLIARRPRAAPGRQRVPMTARYEAAGPAALALMLQAKRETEAELSRGYNPPDF